MNIKATKNILLASLALPCISATAPALADESKSDPPPPFHVSGKTSRAIQKYTGLTWLAQESVDIGATLAAKLMLGGHPHVKVKAYSLTDCLSGKFKSIRVDLKECSYNKVPLADLKFQTSTPLQARLFKTKNGAPGVTTPVMVAVTGEVDESDVSRALQSPEVTAQLSFLRIDLPGLGDQHLQVLDPKVKLEDGKIKINTWLITANAPKETGISVDIAASPILDAERFIRLKDTKIDSADINDPTEFSKFTQELLNPLIDFGKFDRKTHAFRLSEFDLAKQKLHFTGKLLLAPKPVAAVAAPSKLSKK